MLRIILKLLDYITTQTVAYSINCTWTIQGDHVPNHSGNAHPPPYHSPQIPHNKSFSQHHNHKYALNGLLCLNHVYNY